MPLEEPFSIGGIYKAWLDAILVYIDSSMIYQLSGAGGCDLATPLVGAGGVGH